MTKQTPLKPNKGIKEEIRKGWDFEYTYTLNRVKSAELEVADFEECGEELKEFVSEVIDRCVEERDLLYDEFWKGTNNRHYFEEWLKQKHD